MTDHDKLRRLAENATPGPWITSDEGAADGYRAVLAAWLEDDEYITDDGVPEADAEFIAAANPTTVLALLDDLATVTAECDAYRRGQGPAPTPATPGTTALHETHPIPNSRGDDQ